jgi:hypothetical protein
VGRVGRWADGAHEVTIRAESSGKGLGGVLDFKGVCHWQGRFEQCWKIGARSVKSREKEKLGFMLSRTTCHYDGRNCQDLEVCEDQRYHFQAIVIDCLACTEAKWCCSNISVA